VLRARRIEIDLHGRGARASEQRDLVRQSLDLHWAQCGGPLPRRLDADDRHQIDADGDAKRLPTVPREHLVAGEDQRLS
jgi:hypothetical protein